MDRQIMRAGLHRNIHAGSTTKKVLNALGVFGGVQMLTILCSVLRTKLVALWIGPVGVGIITLYNSTIDMITQTSQLNLRQSAVRDISVSSGTDEAPRIIATVRKLALLVGIAGTAGVLLLSPLLSLWAFGDLSHTPAFMLMSVMLYFSASAMGEMAVMQGLDRLKRLARCSLFTVVCATLLAVPLFYFFRARAIVPVIISFAFFNFMFARLFRERMPGACARDITFQEARRAGGPMIRLGFYMTLSAFASLLAANIYAIYLNHTESTDTVGIYQAGFTLVNAYVGVIFTAIAMEYYPRLTASIAHKARAGVLVSHEMGLALKILMPVVVVFICADQLIVRILYADSFNAMLPYIAIGITGTFLRAASWCMAFVILAKGDGPTFVFTETVSAAVMLALDIAGFRFLGFAGLGVAYVLWYLVYTLIVWYVYRYRYQMRLHGRVGLLLAVAMLIGVVTLILKSVAGPWVALGVMLPCSLVAAAGRFKVI